MSIEDLELLQALEDRLDLASARQALRQPGRVAWDKVKADLNLSRKKPALARERKAQRRSR